MQPVRELDQQHPHIGRNRQQELPEIFGLRFLARHQLQPLDLGQPVDDLADLAAEDLIDLGAGRVGVLDRVVQQADRDRRVVELQIGKDGGDFEWVVEERIARGPLLAAVLLHRIDIGAVEQRLVGVRIIGEHLLDQLVLAHHRPGRRGVDLVGPQFGELMAKNAKGARTGGRLAL